MTKQLIEIVALEQYRLDDVNFRADCKRTLDETGVLVLPGFLKAAAVADIQKEGSENQHLAYYTSDSHNIYLTPPDPEFPDSHPRNRKVLSSKGCITTDQVPDDSMLHTLYAAPEFRKYLCAVLGEKELHEYADSLSSINLHYASEGQELGWHYDNSSFAITLLIQKPASGGEFDYVKDVRDADNGDMNYKQSASILDGEIRAERLAMDPGALVLFRGRNSMHRVTPTEGDRTRILVVLAYNSAPGISLSDSAKMTFYGRLE
jgi:hypothetical protein